MLGIIIWGAFLYAGATRFELKWAALVALGAAIAFTALGAAFRQNDPICGQYVDCSISAAGLGYNLAIKFAMAMLFYGIGRGCGAIYRRIRRSPQEPGA